MYYTPLIAKRPQPQGTPENARVNLEAVTLYSYSDRFLLVPKKKVTGIRCNLRIDRRTHQFNEIDASTEIESGYDKKSSYSVFLGLLPILNRNFLLFVELCEMVCIIEGKEIYEVKQVTLVNADFYYVSVTSSQLDGNSLYNGVLKQNEKMVKIMGYANYLKDYLLVEGYYFSYFYDLSLSRAAFAEGYPLKKKFVWNMFISKNLARLNEVNWFVGLMQGFVKQVKLTLYGTKIEYMLLTRRSWTKGGTRYNSRGLDLKGNVANFCETEQLVFINDICFSHLQIRGSVPVFWKQTGLYAEVEFSHMQYENEQCFKKHLSKLQRNYQKVMCLNLLCKHKSGEIDLTLYYEKLLTNYKLKDIRYEFFDLHCACKGQHFERCNYLIDKLARMNDYFGYYSENIQQNKVLSFQKGVMRANCLDSLDRTNLVQSKIAYHVLTTILQRSGFNMQSLVGSDSIIRAADDAESTNILLMILKNAWADNGDMISKHYTGTGSTHTNVTRTGSRDIKGMMDHGYKTCRRLYQQYVEDNSKQYVIDLLIGEHTYTMNLSELEARLKDLGQEEHYANDELTSSAISNI